MFIRELLRDRFTLTYMYVLFKHDKKRPFNSQSHKNDHFLCAVLLSKLKTDAELAHSNLREWTLIPIQMAYILKLNNEEDFKILFHKCVLRDLTIP